MNIVHKNAWYYYSTNPHFLQLSIYTKGEKINSSPLWHMLQLFNYTTNYAETVIFPFLSRLLKAQGVDGGVVGHVGGAGGAAGEDEVVFGIGVDPREAENHGIDTLTDVNILNVDVLGIPGVAGVPLAYQLDRKSVV